MDKLLYFGIFIGFFWLVEHRFGNKKGRRFLRPQILVDVALYLFNITIANAVSLFIISILAVVILVPAGVISLAGLGAKEYHGFGPIAKLSMPIQFLVAFIVADLSLYWIHRRFHGRTLWKFHAVHHSSEHLDWLSSVRAHPVNDIVGNALLIFPFILLGFDPLVAAVPGPAIGVFALLGHADVDWDWGPLRKVIASPVFHRWHHSREPEAIDKNFASFLPLWDILFGTFYMPDNWKPSNFGIHGPVEHTFFGMLTHPFRKRKP